MIESAKWMAKFRDGRSPVAIEVKVNEAGRAVAVFPPGSWLCFGEDVGVLGVPFRRIGRVPGVAEAFCPRCYSGVHCVADAGAA